MSPEQHHILHSCSSDSAMISLPDLYMTDVPLVIILIRKHLFVINMLIEHQLLCVPGVMYRVFIGFIVVSDL